MGKFTVRHHKQVVESRHAVEFVGMDDLRVETYWELGTPTEPHPVAQHVAQLWEAAEEQLVGSPDFASTAREIATNAAPDADEALVLIVGSDARGEIVGFIHADIPRRDNTDSMYVEMPVRPGASPVEVMSQLWPAVRELAATESRHQVIWFEPTALGEGTLPPRAGGPAVQQTAMTDFLTEVGFGLSQTEIVSTMDMAAEQRPAVTADAVVHEHYQLESWVGPPPEHHVESLVDLLIAMSVDAPKADRIAEAEKWDVERLRRADRQVIAAGRQAVWTVAVDKRTGRTAGHTFLELRTEDSDNAFQMDTLVHAQHRGNGLGLAMKRANLAHLREVSPQIRRVHTYNAAENEWMLAINRQLGARPVWALGVWLLKLDAA